MAYPNRTRAEDFKGTTPDEIKRIMFYLDAEISLNPENGDARARLAAAEDYYCSLLKAARPILNGRKEDAGDNRK